jgi:hypothetical protein
MTRVIMSARVHPRRIDLIGQCFGYWTVIAYAQNQRWFCVCACGTHAIVNGQSLRKGMTKSCGCLRSAPKVDSTGKRFGRWTVNTYAGGGKWHCVCDCGARAVVRGRALQKQQSRSCGCFARELLGERSFKHGMSGSREYKCWATMKQRCFNPRNSRYKDYGGRGISVCDDWLPFIAYFADTGERPEGMTLDRINNDGDYGPTNWQWATPKQQIQNRRPQRKRRAVKRRRAEPVYLEDPPF